jgi:putative membrane protein
MISVPIIRWVAGQGAERIGIAAGVLAQVVLVVSVLVSEFRFWAFPIIVGVPFLGWLSEVIGSRTGVPFGAYSYTDVLKPQVAHVPVLIPLAWLMMIPPSWAIGAVLAPHRPLLQYAIAAGAFTAWDLYLDPQMVKWDFWRWKRKGVYLGIPVSNYLGWFAVAFVIALVFSMISRAAPVHLVIQVPKAPLVGVFVITWLLQFIGQMLFWKLRVSAVVGFLVMGLFVLATALRAAGLF